MRYLIRFGLMLSLLVATFGATVVTADAQRRGRRAIVIYRPYWGPGWGWHNPYYDPYYREREYRYNLERDLDGNRRELEEHREKYYADGVLTPKERKELADDEKDYNNSIRRLRQYRRDY